MKKIVLAVMLIASYSNHINAQREVNLNTEKSVLYWLGSMSLGFGNHHGSVQFMDGKLITANDKIIGGTFTIDMNTIANIDGGYNEGLVDHLKNEDFFDVPIHPTSKLVITEVDYKNGSHIIIKALLTIKQITLPIEFPAEISYERKEITTSFTIDRTRWGITHSSKSIINIKEHAIADEIDFEVKLIFN